MKVIKSKEEFKPFVQTCYKCDAQLEIELISDLYAVKQKHSDPRDYGMPNTLYFFTCPECHSRNNVSSSKIPKSVQDFVVVKERY